MSNEFLSQDEVDSLLQGVVDEPVAAAPGEGSGGVHAFKLGTQERIPRDRMPALAIINDRFARRLRVGLGNFIRRSPQIAGTPPRIVKYSDFVTTLASPTNLNLTSIKPLKGNALFVFEPALVLRVVDSLFGGDGRFAARGAAREFTPTEQRIIARLSAIALDDYQSAWQSIYPLRFELIRSEMHAQFAAIAAPTQIVVVSTFDIEIGTHKAALHVCIPYATLEPIREWIERPVQCEPTAPDRRWSDLLHTQVQSADVEIVANLASTTMKLRDLMAMKPGDVLPIDLKANIEANVNGVPLIECGYGEVNGRYALRVERMLQQERLPQDPTRGAAHG